MEKLKLEKETEDLKLYTDNDGNYRLFMKDENGKEFEMTYDYTECFTDEKIIHYTIKK